jgi:hypothetical protein
MKNPKYFWNPKAKRYQENLNGKPGSFLSRSAVQEINLQMVSEYRDQLASITKLFTAGKLSLSAWVEGSARTIRDLALITYAIAKGGKDQMFANDYLAVGRYLKDEYKFLKAFAEEAATGNLTDKQIAARIDLYGKRANKLPFDMAEQQNGIDGGDRWMRRDLNLGESCEDCIYYASKGWQPIGSLPLPTQDCSCRGNCKCSVRYSNQASVPRSRDLKAWILDGAGFVR